MVTIIPAILAITEEQYRETLKKIEESEFFEDGWVHIDIIDGKFADNVTVEAEIIAKYPTNRKIELHLMVENPKEIMNKLAGMDLGRVITHIESGNQGLNLAINPDTPLSSLEGLTPESILIMAVQPGKQGQEFIPETLEKIKEIRKSHPDILIGVDGGISPENAKLIVDAGADYLVVGSHLIEGNIDENLETFWEKIHT